MVIFSDAIKTVVMWELTVCKKSIWRKFIRGSLPNTRKYWNSVEDWAGGIYDICKKLTLQSLD